MALDHGIIQAGLKDTQSVDLNALMKQRVTGLENINVLERQRQADQVAAKTREAAAAKEQEEKTFRELLPAYSYGLQNPSDVDGMLSLVPKPLQGAVAPYLEQVRGRKPQDVVAALTGSLAASEIGQKFLEHRSRMATADIQRMQAQTSIDRLNFDRSKRAQGAGVARATTGALPGAQIGTQAAPPAAAVKNMTQEERRRGASVNYTVKNAERVAELIQQNPDAVYPSGAEFVTSFLPFGIDDKVRATAQSKERQQLYNRMTQVVATMLRLETGAAFTRPEHVTDAQAFMADIGDYPETVRDKIDALQDRVTSAVRSTGRAWTPDNEQEFQAVMNALDMVKNTVSSGNAAPAVSPKSAAPQEKAAPQASGGRPKGVGPDWHYGEDIHGNGAWVSPDRKRVIGVE